MKNRFVRFAFLLPLLCLAGCGDAPKPKTEDPDQIEKIRQQSIENAKREQSSSK